MSENMNTTDLQKLASDWLKIKHFLQTKNKLDYPLFKSTFEKTFEALLECRGADAIDKKYMKLIVNAYNFINTNNNSLDDTPQAAFVLTERMLNSTWCCFNKVIPSMAFRKESQRFLLWSASSPSKETPIRKL